MKSNIILSAIIAATFTLGTTSCSNKANKAATQEEVVAEALQVDDILAGADSLAGKEVTFEGVCTHICKHGGKKMFLLGSDDTKTLRVDASQEIGSFPAEVVNNIIEVKGTLVEERIDESVIARMEEQYKKINGDSHGENKEVGCESEKNAHGQKEINTFAQRMQDYRDKIAQRKEKEGKEYLSFYAVKGISYEIKQ